MEGTRYSVFTPPTQVRHPQLWMDFFNFLEMNHDVKLFPGFWLMHCHIDFHAEMGMALLFKVGDDSKYKKPPKDFPKCGDFGRSQGVEEYQAQFFPAETITDHREYYSIHASASGRRVEACYFSTLLLIITIIVM